MTEQFRTRVYDAEAPREGWGTRLMSLLRDVREGWGLAKLLFTREVRTQYRQSLLGVLWAFVPPVLAALGLLAATRGRVIDVGAMPIPLPAFVIVGVIVWQTFADAVTGPITAVAKGKTILVRVAFPREALIVAKVLEVLLGFAVRLLLVTAVLAYYGIAPGASLLWLPLVLVVLLAAGTLIGVLFAPLSLVTDDVQRGMSVVLLAWMFMTPVFYAPRGDSDWARVVAANPMSVVVNTAREALTGMQISQPGEFVIIGAVALLGLLLTGIVFRAAVPYALERLS
jgi:lipopolysaccharide transport system permease protein